MAQLGENLVRIFNDLTEGAFFRTSEGVVREVNDRALELLGLSREEFISGEVQQHGWALLDINGLELAPDMYPSARALQSGQRIADVEVAVRRPGQQQLTWLLVTAYPVFLSKEIKPDLVFVTLRDISAYKASQEILALSEEKYRSVFASTPDAMTITTVQNGTYVEVNDRFLELTGFKEEEVIGKSAMGLGIWEREEDRDRLVELLRERGFVNGFITVFRMKDGTRLHGMLSARVFHFHGSPHLLMLTRDISDRIRAEEELRIAENRFRMLIEHAPGGMVIVSAEGKFTYISPTAWKMFGYSPEENIPLDPNALTHPEDLPMVLEHLQRLFLDPASHPVLQYRFLNRDGTWRWIESTFTNLLAQPGVHGIVINFRDITESRLAEEEIQRMNQSLEKSVAERTEELMAAIRELESFTYTVSHDLKAPVRAIGGFTKILQEEHLDGLSPEAQRVFDVILSNTRKMEQLIDDLLAFSRLSRTEMNYSKISMQNLAKSCFRELNPQGTRSGIRFEIDDIPDAEGDFQMVRLLWIHLISNALKFTRPVKHPVIRISGKEDGGAIVYSVQDNGVGFDMRYIDKLFEVFQRLHNPREYEGNGVGLAIVHRIIQRHGGMIRAEGYPGKGATFQFTLRPSGSPPLKPI